jgi:hypothetical protein
VIIGCSTSIEVFSTYLDDLIACSSIKIVVETVLILVAALANVLLCPDSLERYQKMYSNVLTKCSRVYKIDE